MARVSSDEQALGYSLDSQMSHLKKFCEQRGIEIVYEFKEDHSAKTFERPAFEKFLQLAKSNKGWIDCLLFISWDRFSRNTTDAYVMIRTLKKLGIEAQASSQPIDFSIPESKFLLAYYLTFPEVDNDRRSIKIKDGIRAAWKAGRWTSTAPKGYLNSRDEYKKPLLIPNPKLAPAVVKMFELAATGMPQYRIRHEIKEMGLNYSRNGIAIALRNAIYMGKIVIPADEDHPITEVVDAVHEALVTPELFYRVQDVINGKANRKVTPKNTKIRPEFPLRGLLLCFKCDALMTASASTGKMGVKFYYYHCNACRKQRIPARLVNDELDEILELFKFKSNPTELFNIVLNNYLGETKSKSLSEVKHAEKELEIINKRLEKLQLLFIDGNISNEEYSKLRIKFTSESEQLKQSIYGNKNASREITEALKNSINLFKNLPNALKSMELEDRYQILSSIFQEKLKFDGKNCRTPKINEAVSLLLSIDGGSRGNKKRDKLKNLSLSLQVDPERFELSSK